MKNINIEEIRKNNRKSKSIVNIPKPFMKWAGGKRQLISQIDPYIPQKYNKYIEPFVGGGALFFYLLPKDAILIDNNPFLINCYNTIKHNVHQLIEELKHHKNESEYYYDVRSVDRTPDFLEWTNVQKASRSIFLNRCCYNGLFRVNSKGFFNVPFGKYKNPKFLDENNLLAVHSVLQNVEIYQDSFDKCLKYAKKDDFIYFDPPYVPISKTANFTGYTKESFGKKEQEKLKDTFDLLNSRNCKIMQSNSHSDFILNLYKDYNVIPITAKRAINSDPSKRGNIKEVLIMNY